MSITAERLRDLAHYDPETGVMRWRVNRDRAGNAKAGDALGHPDKDGHLRAKVDGRSYYIHRLAFLYMNGDWPAAQIDHRDCNPANNAWENLRPATQSENQRNQSVAKNNQLGVKGVRRFRDKYRAAITVNGKTQHLGTYATAEVAHAVYRRAVRAQHGEFGRAE